MKHTITSKNMLRSSLLMAVTVLCTLFCLWLFTLYDNKYTLKAEIAQANTVLLPENGLRYLVDGWEIYPDSLLSPADFSAESLPLHYDTWAGEYANLSPFHEDGNPYGTATYRIKLKGQGMMSLYLQEPLCASRVFVNGQELGGTGNVEPEDYRPIVRDTVYSFSLNGEADLIIQLANYSHYYGGLWFPPAVGSPDAISRAAASRMIFYGLFLFASLTLSLFCVILWLENYRQRKSVEFYFGMLCFFFALRISYPFLRLWGVPLVRLFYALEDAAALLGIYYVIRIISLLFLTENFGHIKEAAFVISLGMCAVVVILPLVVLPLYPALTPFYGYLVSWYKVLAAAYVVLATLYGCLFSQPYTRLVLTVTTINGVCLLYNVLSIGRFEPIIGGWAEEYGAFSMVIAFAVMMVRHDRKISKENARLNEHLQEEVEEKTRQLRLLLSERGQLMAELGHDMKSPLTSISNMAQIIRLNDIMLDEGTRERIQNIEAQCNILTDRLHTISEFAEETGQPALMEPLSLNQFLSGFHHSNRPVIELTGPDFVCKLTSLPCKVKANRQKLSRALENLIFNAADFTPPEGRITLSLERDDSFAYIRVTDNGRGIPENIMHRIFDRSFTTRADNGGQGLGLAITRAIILEHGGEISVSSELGKGTEFVIQLPLKMQERAGIKSEEPGS